MYKTDVYELPAFVRRADQRDYLHQAPLDGSHVPLTFSISAAANGPDAARHMQIYGNGVKQSDYVGLSSLPSGARVTLPGPGTHRVAVQTFDSTQAKWVGSVIYVSNS